VGFQSRDLRAETIGNATVQCTVYSVQCTVYIEGLFQITFTVPLSQIPFSSRMLKSLKFHCQFKLFWKINKGIESLPQTLNL